MGKYLIMRRRFLSTAILFTCWCLITSSVIAQDISNTENVLRVGITPVYQPLVYRRGNEIVGLEIDLAKLLASSMGREVEFVEMKWDQQLPALVSGKTDIVMSGMSITDDRERVVDFSNPYLSAGLLAMFRLGDSANYPNKDALMGASFRVGVIDNTIAQVFAREHFRDNFAVVINSPDEAVEKLLAGEFDVFLHDAPSIWWQQARHQQTLVASNYFMNSDVLGWAIRKGDDEVMNAANKMLEVLRATGSLQEQIDHHMSND